jgi:hypothetical protein
MQNGCRCCFDFAVFPYLFIFAVFRAAKIMKPEFAQYLGGAAY